MTGQTESKLERLRATLRKAEAGMAAARLQNCASQSEYYSPWIDDLRGQIKTAEVALGSPQT